MKWESSISKVNHETGKAKDTGRVLTYGPNLAEKHTPIIYSRRIFT